MFNLRDEITRRVVDPLAIIEGAEKRAERSYQLLEAEESESGQKVFKINPNDSLLKQAASVTDEIEKALSDLSKIAKSTTPPIVDRSTGMSANIVTQAIKTAMDTKESIELTPEKLAAMPGVLKGILTGLAGMGAGGGIGYLIGRNLGRKHQAAQDIAAFQNYVTSDEEADQAELQEAASQGYDAALSNLSGYFANKKSGGGNA